MKATFKLSPQRRTCPGLWTCIQQKATNGPPVGGWDSSLHSHAQLCPLYGRRKRRLPGVNPEASHLIKTWRLWGPKSGFLGSAVSEEARARGQGEFLTFCQIRALGQPAMVYTDGIKVERDVILGWALAKGWSVSPQIHVKVLWVLQNVTLFGKTVIADVISWDEVKP